MAEAQRLAAQQAACRAAGKAMLEPPKVISALKAVASRKPAAKAAFADALALAVAQGHEEPEEELRALLATL